MNSNELLPHKVQWCASKPKSYELHAYYIYYVNQLDKNIYIYISIKILVMKVVSADRKKKCLKLLIDERNLMNEHEYNSCVSEAGSGKQSEGVGVRQKNVPKCPVDSRG